MRVCVVGCGAVGSLFAANLATLDDVEVWAFDLRAGARRRDQPRRPAADRRGRGRGHVCARRPTPPSCRRATSGSSRRRRCTPSRRSRRRRTPSPTAASRPCRTASATRRCSRAHVERVIRGTTFPAGKIVEPGVVQWDVKGDTTLGPFEDRPAPFGEVERLADACTRGGMPTTAVARRARAAVAQGDLQRGDEPARRAHRAHARPGVRAARSARARLAARRRGQGGRVRAGDRARLRSRGADRLRGAARGRVRPQGVDAPGRRGAPADRGRLSERRHRGVRAAARRADADARGDLGTRERSGGVVDEQ